MMPYLPPDPNAAAARRSLSPATTPLAAKYPSRCQLRFSAEGPTPRQAVQIERGRGKTGPKRALGKAMRVIANARLVESP
jgi:hypothetical protein